jgi:Ca-activated chloride channel homolog
MPRFICKVFLSVALVAAAWAQTAEPSKPSSTSAEPPKTATQSSSAVTSNPDQKNEPVPAPIRVEVNEVIIPVTVTDGKGRFVNDLEEKDFHVIEDNKPQKIRFFTREQRQPIVVGFLMDLSNMSKIHWKNYQEAAIELVENLLKDDPRYTGYLISYATDAELQQDTTKDPEKIVEKLRKMKPSGGSALYDAVYMACTNRRLVQGEPIEPRRVIVIIGDGHDDASKHSLNQVIELAQRSLVTVYGVSTTAFGFANDADYDLDRLAIETGGRVVHPLGDVYADTDGYLSHPSDDGNYALSVGTGAYAGAVMSKMFHAVTDIAGEVTTQYIIRYIPELDDADKPKPFHNVTVLVDLANVKVRARKGYYTTIP